MQITVHELDGVGGRERRKELARPPHRFPEGGEAFSEQRLERWSAQELHDRKGPTVIDLAELDELHDVGMPETMQGRRVDPHPIREVATDECPP
jgi:hypothetical protein